jgi:phenylpropionate dioxygenase-like ring-hydroxylating dioxygenase large terminal subunit
MIKPSLPPACYTEESWFELERTKIFGEHWLLACLTQQVSSENSFVTRTLGGVPVLIQNVGSGKLRAFRNVCTHRASPIQLENYGNRKMACPYHGWTFGRDGELRGIPNEKLHNITEDTKATLCLKPYALSIVGNFVFVNLSSNPKPITEQFPEDQLRMLTEVSTYFAPDVSYTTFTGNYNWKLNFENISEYTSPHIPFVHANTFASLLKGKDGVLDKAEKSHSLFFNPDSPISDVRFLGEKPLPLTGRVDIKDTGSLRRASMSYTPHWFSPLLTTCDPGVFFASPIFPNVNFGYIHGEHFFLQQFVPLAPDRTEFHSWVFTSRLKEGVLPQPHLLWGIHHAEKRVVDEDIAVFNGIQKTLATASTLGLFGDNEITVSIFGRYYMQLLTGETSHE